MLDCDFCELLFFEAGCLPYILQSSRCTMRKRSCEECLFLHVKRAQEEKSQERCHIIIVMCRRTGICPPPTVHDLHICSYASTEYIPRMHTVDEWVWQKEYDRVHGDGAKIGRNITTHTSICISLYMLLFICQSPWELDAMIQYLLQSPNPQSHPIK
ncbi:Hypothetical predicted protein [Podarcis lilfordi]|uniref:Uncharacterized protein n=1 Tax=Podarcis lilfordi TaxID=74358 RepID=A0AA35NX70_9SAUR|nr:Hypothetical predicted protein [Podarcis lilfordi]